MANYVNPDQTPPSGAVLSGLALFAQSHLSKYIGKIWYVMVLFSVIANSEYYIWQTVNITYGRL